MKLSVITLMASLHQTISFTSYHHQRHSTALSQVDPSRIKKAGAGVATMPPGNNCSFDPNEAGKLQGTGNCDDRVAKGASYGAAPSSGLGGASTPSKTRSSNLTSLISGNSQY